MISDIITFGGVAQPELSQAAAGIIPAPLEATVSWGEGTRLGPAAIMLASSQMELYDEALGEETYRRGIYTHQALRVDGPVEATLGRIEKAVADELSAGRLPVVLGGEHTVTLGALRAVAAARGQDFTVLSLDAHLDMRDTYEGLKLSHACVMRRAWELGLKVRHFAARSCSVEEARFIAEQGIEPLWAERIHRDPDWLEAALDGLSGPVYLSLDIDGLDPSLMPDTGTPEPGGVFWHQLAEWLAAVAARHPIVGLDLVELAPSIRMPASSFTAARLVYRAMGLALKGPR
jgi:agmatinase